MKKYFSTIKIKDPEVPELTPLEFPLEPSFNYLEVMDPTPEKRTYEVKEDPISGEIIGLIELFNKNPKLKNNIKITSGYRPHSQGSFHSTGQAIDIIPLDGNFESLTRTIASDPDIVAYLKQHNLGIISEVTPEEQALYKATGANLHFGPDKAAIKGLAAILNKYGIQV